MHTHSSNNFWGVAADLHVRTRGFNGDNIRLKRVATGVCRVSQGYGRPSTYITPAELGWHQGDIRSSLHDGVINRNIGLMRKCFGIKSRHRIIDFSNIYRGVRRRILSLCALHHELSSC